MSSRYELIPSDDEKSYQFTTESGNKYTAYFTEFFLMNEMGEDIKIFSFGFDCMKTLRESPNRFDARVKATILNIISDFFIKYPNEALLYICSPSDGKARNRHITFSLWFKEFGNDFTKYDSRMKYAEHDFYSSFIILNNNPQKDDLINAFFFTLDYWMGE